MNYISKIEGHPLKADGLTESPRLLDKEPYLFRPSFANGYGYETLIGGTCGVNQLADNTSVTVTAGGNQNINFNLTKYGFISGHKYLLSCRQNTTLTSIDRNTFVVRDDDNSQNYYENATSNYHLLADTYYWIYNATFTSGGFFRLWCNNPNIDVTYDNFQAIDLTSYFNPTIADYVYTLESGTSGAGVAWLKNNGFFGADYYPYNAGGLLSVKTSKKINRDSNNVIVGEYPLDDIELRGILKLDGNNNLYYDGDTYESNGSVTRKYGIVDLGSLEWLESGGNFFCQNAVSNRKTNANAICAGYTQVEETTPSGLTVDGTFAFQENVITRVSFRDTRYTTTEDFKTAMSGKYLVYELATPTTETADAFTNPMIVDGNGTEEFVDGNVYGIVDLGSLNWGFNPDSGHQYFSTTDLNNIIKKPANVGIIGNIKCSKYSTVAYSVVYANAINKTIAVSDTGRVAIYDTSTLSMTEAQFKSLMNGVYLIYEKATSPSVEMPVGHETIYVDNSDKTKLDNLPDISNDGDGTYVINQENGKQSLVTPNATDISYSNTSSELTATKVQGAIDEVNTKVGTKANSSDVYTKSNTYNKTEVNSMLTLVKSATSGNPCTFSTDLADNLVSLTAEIVASGGGGTPSTPIPIVGYSSANITRCGINQWDEEWESGSIDYNTGAKESNPDMIRSKNYIPCISGAEYYSKGAETVIYFYDSAYTMVPYTGYGAYRNGADIQNHAFTIPSGACYMLFRLTSDYGTTYNNDISINYPSSDTSYHPYTGNTYTIAFGQTVYGGVLDVTRGKLHVTWGSVDLGSLSWINYGNTPNYDRYISTSLDSLAKTNGNVLCSALNNVWNTVNSIWLGGGNGKLSATSTVGAYSDATAFKNAVTGYKLVYELATPIEIQLTPVQISALVGTNNITSDLGGNVEVRYMAGEVASQVADIVKTELPDEHRYSTNEQIVGWWTDGRPIYEKILSYTFSADSTTLVIDTVYHTLAIIDISGFLLSSNNDDAILINGCADATSSSYVVFNGVTYDAIVIKRAYTDVCGSTPTAYVTVRYIKS